MYEILFPIGMQPEFPGLSEKAISFNTKELKLMLLIQSNIHFKAKLSTITQYSRLMVRL